MGTVSSRAETTPRWRALLRLDVLVAVLGVVVLLPGSIAMLTQLEPRPDAATTALAIGTFVLLHAASFLAVRFPVTALGIASILMCVLTLAPGIRAVSGVLFLSSTAYLLVLGQVAVQRGTRVAIAALGSAIFGAALITLTEPDFTAAMKPGAFIGLAGAVSAAWAAGRLLRLRRSQTEERARVAVERAIADERMRISRDLHDIVAHSMTVMIAQSEVARALLRDDPERSERALGVVIDSGRDALRGMRAVVAVDGEAALRPIPAVDQIDDLLASVRTPSVDVQLVETGDRAALRPDVALALHHGVREALTNAVRHAAPPLRIEVRLSWGRSRVVAEVSDDGGSGPARSDLGAGTGLIGIAERVRSAGGTLSTDDRRPRGWTVRIDLPVNESPAHGGREEGPA